MIPQSTRDNNAFCIRCGVKIPFNLDNPFCIKCGGSCCAMNRFSASEQSELFCHKCGESAYVSEDSPLCGLCQLKHK